MKSALGDVEGACRALSALLDPLHPNPGRSFAEVGAARKGPLFILRQAIGTNSWYKDIQAQIEKSDVAHTAMAPELRDLTGKVLAGEESAVKKALERSAVLRKSLRPGATAGLEKGIADHYTEKLWAGIQAPSAAPLQTALQEAFAAAGALEGEASHRGRLCEHAQLRVGEASQCRGDCGCSAVLGHGHHD